MARTTKKKEEEKIDLSGVKSELKDYVDVSIKKSIKEELEKSNKRLVREKNKKILVRNIIIIILLAIIGFLLFVMYKDKYFNRLLGCNDNCNKSNETINNDTPKEASLDDLINEFAYMLDNISIHEDSGYINDYYNGKLTDEIKNYIAFNNIDINKLETENEYNIFDSALLKNEYNKLFDTSFTAVNFNYLENKVRYLNKMDYFITDSVIEKKQSNIKREIVDIEVDGDRTKFTCVEGLIKDGKLYNVLDKKEIKYTSDQLSHYEKYLTMLVYTFVDGKLVGINQIVK